jgi:hypothetical protein
MTNIKIGDKVRSVPSAFTRVVGVVTALHRETVYGHSACASVYCGKYESVLIPLNDLVKINH